MEKSVCAFCGKVFRYEYHGKDRHFCNKKCYEKLKTLIRYHSDPEKAKRYHRWYKSTVLGRQKMRELWKKREKSEKRKAWKRKYKSIATINVWLLREKWKNNPRWRARQRENDRKRRLLKDRKVYRDKAIRDGYMGSKENLKKDITYLNERIRKIKKVVR